MDPALRLLLGTVLVVVLGWAPFACSATPLPKVSPATQEALVVLGITELRDRCTVLFADGDPPASRARDACLVLAAIDRGLMVLEPSGSEKIDDEVTSPGPEPSSPAVNPTPGNATRDAGDGGA